MEKTTEAERLALTRSILALMDDWGLQAGKMMAILNMPESIKVRSFARYGDDEPFPDDPQVMKRAYYLLRIADALRTTYPRSPHMGKRWMRQVNRRFGKRSPLDLIVERGETGLVAVLSELDCTYAWDCTGSKGV